MSDYVIVEHQWLFDQLSRLVTVSSENPSCGDGIILKSKLPKIEIEGGIKMENLISLLDDKKILASYTQNSKVHYYLPFVLPYCQQYADKFKFLLLEPLLVRFSSGFLPRGFFCSLVVHFLQNIPDGWISLHENTNKHFRNIMTFQLPNNLYVRLQDKIYYLEVQVRHYQHCKGESMLEELEIICKYLHKVCKTLKFDYRKLQFGFLCQHGKWDEESHMAVLLEPSSCNLQYCRKCRNQIIVLPFTDDPLLIYCEKCNCRINCKKCRNTTDMGYLHKLWFKEVKESNGLEATPTMNMLNHYITDISPYYYEVGLELGIVDGELEVIKANSSEIQEKCRKMLGVWLARDTFATWRKLCDTLEKRNQCVLAKNIREKILSM